MESQYQQLLMQWCDGLLHQQLYGAESMADGGIFCPSCKHIHGRCPDAIYALMCLADRTQQEKYLTAARKLFKWHENLICDDGTAYNDSNGAWNGITAFAVINLHEALVHHGHLLTEVERGEFESRMKKMCSWVSNTIGPSYQNNINYIAASAAVQALMGRYFGDDLLLQRASKAAEYVFNRFTENGLLYGEGLPHDHITARGCRPVDIGYDVEESVPLLIRYAIAMDDKAALDKLTIILRQQLEFMMPDGAWDNSFGTRCAKWTYWGSRTSDGCQSGYAMLAHRDPMFAEAARRNLELMERCTHDGLLYGGPDYKKHGEPPCTHHTFTHANGVAAALDAGIERYSNIAEIPSDYPKQTITYFPEIDTYKLSLQDWRATVTGYDFWLDKGHATGGTLTLLWHKKVGPVLLSSVLDYRMLEPLNMQLTLRKSCHRTLTPRLERNLNEKRYSFCYDTKAKIQVEELDGKIKICSDAQLVSLQQESLPTPVSCRITYTLESNSLLLETAIQGPHEGVQLVVPVIAEAAQVSGGPHLSRPEQIFFLTGGFCAQEYLLQPDADGKAWVRIAL